MGMVTGNGSSQISRSGNSTAFAMRMPKIAPEAPMVGTSGAFAAEISKGRLSPPLDQARAHSADEKKLRKRRLPQLSSRSRPNIHNISMLMRMWKRTLVQKNVGEGLPDAQRDG